MASLSAIQWTEYTWNPVTGCTKISPGCKHCYAERMARRLQAMGHRNYEQGFKVVTHEHALSAPLKWKRPKLIFVNSMSDLFHNDVPLDFIQAVFRVISKSPQHVFQILTKRSQRLLCLSGRLDWPSNLWMGVSVEARGYLHRIDDLRQTPAKTKFLSLEPLLESLSGMNLDNIDWCIVGGESGPAARPMKQAWVAEVRDQCLSADVPFFFKQWGGPRPKQSGRELEGRTWSEMPMGMAR